MEGAARTRVIAAAVILVVAVPLGVVAAAGSGGGDDDPAESGIRAERDPRLSEIQIYIDDQGLNTPERTDGRRTVTVRCVDEDGLIIASQDEPWPMTRTDAGAFSPHAHIPVNPARLGQVTSCRLGHTKPLIEVDVTG